MSTFLKKELDNNGFTSEEVFPKIILVEDFVTKEEISKYFDIINNIEEDKWKEEYLKNLRTFAKEKFNTEDIESLVAEGKLEITQNWNDKNLNIWDTEICAIVRERIRDLVFEADKKLIFSGFEIIQRMQEGVELKAHSDQSTDPSIFYAAILYINDDYNGGELYFKNFDFKIKPKAGSLMLFPGTEEYEHGVKHVGEGPIRYVLPGFIKVIDFYEKNKY